MFDRPPPQDLQAEESAINTVLSLGRIPEGLAILTPPDFYHPAHEQMWQTFTWLADQGKPTDANTVHARLTDLGLNSVLKMLPDLVSGPWSGVPDALAEVILDRSGRRHVLREATRMMQDAYVSEDGYESILQRAEYGLSRVPARDSGVIDDRWTIDDLLSADLPEPDWVVNGYLARGERIIITGEEGLGKTTLQRQIGMCAAAGLLPFSRITGGRIVDPVKVMMVDVENPLHIIKEQMWGIRKAINEHGLSVSRDALSLYSRKEGINLGEAGDRRWLQRRIKSEQPDVLVMGPTYKLYVSADEEKDETIARTITSVLDDLRGDAVLVLEHHAGNEQGGRERQMRPIGSSLWRRWPEFGYGIRMARAPQSVTPAQAHMKRVVEFHAWRGPRAVRQWPYLMEAGAVDLPWVESNGYAF